MCAYFRATAPNTPIDFAAGRLRLEPLEEEHLHGCKVCPSIIYIFLNQPMSEALEDKKRPEDAAIINVADIPRKKKSEPAA